MTIDHIVQRLQLKSHPEGGFYREIYKSDDFVEETCLPDNFNVKRRLCTSIYYLLPAGDFSAFHRIKSDELWHYYAGGNIILHLLDIEKGYQKKILGNQLDTNGSFQVMVPANTWFAAEVLEGDLFSLAGCTVSPGFDFDDFELADKTKLEQEFPGYADLIKQLCR